MAEQQSDHQAKRARQEVLKQEFDILPDHK